jgi:hypothetical protein
MRQQLMTTISAAASWLWQRKKPHLYRSVVFFTKNLKLTTKNFFKPKEPQQNASDHRNPHRLPPLH